MIRGCAGEPPEPARSRLRRPHSCVSGRTCAVTATVPPSLEQQLQRHRIAGRQGARSRCSITCSPPGAKRSVCRRREDEQRARAHARLRTHQLVSWIIAALCQRRAHADDGDRHGPLLRTVRYAAATSVPGVARIQASVTASIGAAALASAATQREQTDGKVRGGNSQAGVRCTQCQRRAIMPDASHSDRL